MRVLLINEVCGFTSTGRICAQIAAELEAEGNEVKIAYGRKGYVPDRCKKYAVRIGTDFDVCYHAVYSRITDRHGFASKSATKKFIKWAEDYNPQLIWLHNLHGYYINIEILFEWLKTREHTQIRWTLHDCWPFTGHCGYFSYIGCEKWKSCCSRCPQKKEYPKSLYLDNSKHNFIRKKKIYEGIPNMVLIVPSDWLAKIVSQSMLKDYPIQVQYNKADGSVFCPVKSDFRNRYHLNGKKVILGVANIWEKRKGLQDFIELNKLLDSSYAIVLAGLSPKQRKNLPERMIGIGRTSSEKELAEIYSASDVYINAGREETFGMTTLEAILCGTKVIVYKNTACEEVLNMHSGCGIAVEPGAVHLLHGLKQILEQKT